MDVLVENVATQNATSDVIATQPRGQGQPARKNIKTKSQTKASSSKVQSMAEYRAQRNGLAEVAVATATVQTPAAPAEFIPLEQPAKKAKTRSKFQYSCYLFVKRVFDIFSSGAVLLVLSPVILVCLFGKWVEDLWCPGYQLEIQEVQPDGKKHSNWIERADGKFFLCKLVPDKTVKRTLKNSSPIYVSKRTGKDGKEFYFHKIRSMCPGADKMKQQLIDAGLNEADPPAFKIKNDPRITKFGKFLRATSIDELAQLWDILIGNMSVVGPRPPIPCEVAEYTEDQKKRLAVKGGLLCLWQIQHNRNELSFDEWVKLDVEYIEKQSVWLDLKIIFKGAYMVLFDRSGE
jgi:lipopolysaccharide/colanic/teichoic acid biosynthesis glycosyltransferase